MDEYESLPNQWSKDSIVTFSFEPPDTLNTYNLFINLRNNSKYKYNNLFLITDINFPNGKVVSDTLEYQMTSPDGAWLGTGFGEVKENKFWYKENFQFSETGEYEIKLRQVMRKSGNPQPLEKLDGITEVGFRIENTIN